MGKRANWRGLYFGAHGPQMGHGVPFARMRCQVSAMADSAPGVSNWTYLPFYVPRDTLPADLLRVGDQPPPWLPVVVVQPVPRGNRLRRWCHVVTTDNRVPRLPGATVARG